ncbi:MAG TPA: efflux RND transporter periplasmic adaptor subunit [Leptolyngbyaceae cyanobacterium M33_DOE_097]|uniref:Efflux RND transporter periplasmic adaptor subunit n=1 Tax=Oscillatoriales cyanobacterium SpSt-418 TaxID=2282169 RepID=A0A7C3PLZ6_9CYAN|nr:efflux RND transporter periplasmic adaptor subunit [Leptolyngbyaceae cyanobacterium M33_DOE_097]
MVGLLDKTWMDRLDWFKEQTQKRAVTAIALSLLTLGGVTIFRQLSRPPLSIQAPVTLPVRRADLTITLAANGTIEPEQLINLSPKESGILKRLLVKEGDRVQQGQILAYMDDSNLQGQYLQAKAQLAAAQASLQRLVRGNRSQDIAQASARLSAAYANSRQAAEVYRRYQGLAEQGAISQNDLMQYKTSRDTAQAQVLEYQQALALLQAGARPEDIDQAQAEVAAAEGALETIQAKLDDTAIRAPFAGVVTRKYADPGAFVTPTTAGSAVSSATSSSILALASNNQVVANVAESNITKIRLGQKVRIQADALPGQTFLGTVKQIAAQATVEQNVTSFEVKVAIAEPQANPLRAGMNVALSFEVGQVKQALVVPNAAVTQQEAVTGVFILNRDDRPIFTPITIGATVGNDTEVKAGLSGTERVLLNRPTGDRSQVSGDRAFPGSANSTDASSKRGFPGLPSPPSAPPGQL